MERDELHWLKKAKDGSDSATGSGAERWVSLSYSMAIVTEGVRLLP
jgi:hypothetical protein